jgi:predicted outer membrane repeat protein
MAMQSIEPLEPRIAPATFIVTSLADIGPGTLREAVAEANDRPGADLIAFKEGLTGTIEVLSGQITITDTLTIKGPGATKLNLNAFFLSRILSVSDGDDSKDSPLTVSGLSFFNGVVDGGSGGAIASLESLNVKGCAFMGNRASESGGAIDVFKSALICRLR